MPSIRRPWPVHRRDTDKVQQNAAAGDEKIDGDRSSRESPSNLDEQAATAEKELKFFSTMHRWDPNLEGMRRKFSLCCTYTNASM